MTFQVLMSYLQVPKKLPRLNKKCINGTLKSSCNSSTTRRRHKNNSSSGTRISSKFSQLYKVNLLLMEKLLGLKYKVSSGPWIEIIGHIEVRKIDHSGARKFKEFPLVEFPGCHSVTTMAVFFVGHSNLQPFKLSFLLLIPCLFPLPNTEYFVRSIRKKCRPESSSFCKYWYNNQSLLLFFNLIVAALEQWEYCV